MKRFSKLAALLIWAAMIFAFAGCTDPVTDSDEIVYTFTNQSGVDVILYYNSDAGTEKIELEDWDGTQITWMCKSFTLSNGESCKIKTLDCKMEMWFSPYSRETSPRFGFAVKNTSDDLLKPTRLKVRDFDYNFIIRQGPYIDSMYIVTINASENGTVTADETYCNPGETVTLTYSADTGYELDSYIVTDANGDAIEVTDGTFTMPKSDVTVTATFKFSYVIKPSTEEKVVGDIVLNDGRAIPYKKGLELAEEHRTAAIAIIFYKGTGLNSDAADGTPDTTTSRTLGVGLVHYQDHTDDCDKGLAWCSNSANAYNVDLTTIRCIPIENAGALTFTGDKNGSDNLEQIEAFEGINDTTGEGAADRYPAFYFAKNYKDQKIINETVSRIQADSEYANGWYLPSIAELYQIYACCEDTANGFDINEATYYLSNRWYTFDWSFGEYWSSSHHYISLSYDSAYGFDFEKGDCISRSKESSKSSWVCCIREFN